MLSATHLPWTVQVDARRDEDRPFEAWVRRWWIDDLALVDCECGPCSGTRQRRQMSDTDGEFVVVLITRAGRETVEPVRHRGGAQAGRRGGLGQHEGGAVQRVGAAVQAQPADPAGGAGGGERAGVAPGGRDADGGAPATRLLVSYLDTLSATLPALGSSAVAAARNATLELLMGALRAEGDAPTTSAAQPALRAAMDRYIERHLLDGAVTARTTSRRRTACPCARSTGSSTPPARRWAR